MSSYLSPVIQHNDQRIFVKGSIKEKEIDFLLDTGAEITVIPTKLAQGLNIPASSGMVLGQTVNVKCPHAVSALMNQAKVTSVTSSRWGNLVSNSHSPEYCYTACTSHEPILMYDVCNDWICVRGWRRNDSWLCYAYICSDKWNSRNSHRERRIGVVCWWFSSSYWR